MTAFAALLLSLVTLFGPVQNDPTPTFYTYLPVIQRSEDFHWETIEINPPGFTFHLILNNQSSRVYSRAYIFNPDHPDGYWTQWARVRDQWFSMHYRLEWPGYWVEQHIVEFHGFDYQLEVFPLYGEANS